MDASVKGTLAQSVTEAKAAGLAMQSALRGDILKQQKIIGGLSSADAAEIVGRSRYVSQQQLKLRLMQSAQERAINQADVAARVAAEGEKLAAVKASQLAMLTTIASRGTVSEMIGRGGGPGGGISGIFREVLVIFRELGRGNLTRIPGSVTLLAQYLGVLGKLVKSTAQDAVLAAAAQDKLAASMARAALAAEAKASASRRAAAAETADAAAAQELVAANEAEALTSREAAVAQAQKAEAAITAARIESAAASVTVSPWGWLTAAVVAAGAAAFLTWRHFHRLALEARNLREMLDPLRTRFTEIASAEDESARSHQEFVDWLKKVGAETESLPEKIEKVIKAMREQARAEQELARARGASRTDIEAMEELELKAELEIVRAAQARASAESDAAKSAAQAADAAMRGFNVTALAQAKHVASNAGDIMNAVQDAAQNDPALRELKEALQAGGIQGGDALAAFLAVNPQFAGTARTAGYKPGMTGEQFVNALQTNLPEEVKIGNLPIPATTLGEATQRFEVSSKAAQRLEQIQKELADVLADTKTTYGEKLKAVERLTNEQQDLESALGIKTKYGRQIAEADEQRRRGRGARSELTERERIGGGTPVISPELMVQKRMESHLAQIVRNTTGLGSPAGRASREFMHGGNTGVSWHRHDDGQF